MKKQLWKFLVERGAAYRIWAPSRTNTLFSIMVVFLALPFALFFAPYSIFRTLCKQKIILYELRVQGEFGWLVDLLERVRKQNEELRQSCIVFVRASLRHKGLSHLYRKQAGCQVLWSSGFSLIFSQIVLLQPLSTLRRELIFPDLVSQFGMSEQSLSPTRKLLKKRQQICRSAEIDVTRYVTMAVFTSTTEEKIDPDYKYKFQPRETIGTELSSGVDYLRSRSIGVVMLGFPDGGKSHVPRKMLRLAELGAVGGYEEVALASGCEYFWSDFVGAQWLREPFKKPVLITNHDESWIQRRWNFPNSILNRYMIVPLRFQTPSGSLLSLREAMSLKSCFEMVASGDLLTIRNSPTEIVEAHREMIARIDGTWNETNAYADLHRRVHEIYSDFPSYYVPRFPSTFLERHQYLLD